jgi:hypothetical protein
MPVTSCSVFRLTIVWKNISKNVEGRKGISPIAIKVITREKMTTEVHGLLVLGGL